MNRGWALKVFYLGSDWKARLRRRRLSSNYKHHVEGKGKRKRLGWAHIRGIFGQELDAWLHRCILGKIYFPYFERFGRFQHSRSKNPRKKCYLRGNYIRQGLCDTFWWLRDKNWECGDIIQKFRDERWVWWSVRIEQTCFGFKEGFRWHLEEMHRLAELVLLVLEWCWHPSDWRTYESQVEICERASFDVRGRRGVDSSAASYASCGLQAIGLEQKRKIRTQKRHHRHHVEIRGKI